MMNRRLSVVVGLAFVVTVAPVANVQAQCKNRLVNRSFSCIFRSDNPSFRAGETCLQFENNDIIDPPKFDIDDSGNNSIQGFVGYSCTCDPVGNFGTARFNRSRDSFTCSGSEIVFTEDDFITFPWGMRGRISQSGKAITGVQVDILAYSYVLQCERVSFCGGGAFSVQKARPNNNLEHRRSIDDLSALQEMRRQLETELE